MLGLFGRVNFSIWWKTLINVNSSVEYPHSLTHCETYSINVRWGSNCPVVINCIIRKVGIVSWHINVSVLAIYWPALTSPCVHPLFPRSLPWCSVPVNQTFPSAARLPETSPWAVWTEAGLAHCCQTPTPGTDSATLGTAKLHTGRYSSLSIKM